METVCQPSYPLNSENASPFGTRTVYLAWGVSCAEMALTPKTASTTAMVSVSKDTAWIFLRFISPSSLFAGHHRDVREREHIAQCGRAHRRRLVSHSTGPAQTTLIVTSMLPRGVGVRAHLVPDMKIERRFRRNSRPGARESWLSQR